MERAPDEDYKLPEVEEEGTPSYPQFDINHLSSVQYLTGLDGGGSEKNCEKMAVEVAKFL